LNDPELAQNLNRERAALDTIVGQMRGLLTGLEEAGELLEMAREEDDVDTL